MRGARDKSPKPIVTLFTATLFIAGSVACQKAAPPGAAASASEKPAASARAKNRLTVDLVEKAAFPLPKHLEQKDIAAGSIPFATLFDDGDKLFHTPYNGLDGVGMQHTPAGTPIHRFSVGPVAGSPVPVGVQSCGSCRNMPFGAGAGLANTRVFFDPDQNGLPPFAARDTISLFGNGTIQLLAEEMTEKLLAARDTAAQAAKAKPGTPVRGADRQRRRLRGDYRDGERKRRREVRRHGSPRRVAGSGDPAVRLEGIDHHPAELLGRRRELRHGNAGRGVRVAPSAQGRRRS